MSRRFVSDLMKATFKVIADTAKTISSKPAASVKLSAVGSLVDENFDLINLMRQVSQNKFDVGRRIVKLIVPSSYSSILEAMEANLISLPHVFVSNKTSREELRDNVSDNPFAGKVIAFDAGPDSAREANADEIRNAKVIAAPGLGGAANPERSFNTLNQAKRLFPGQPSLVYCPPFEGGPWERLRIARGAWPYINPSDVFEESEKFYNKVILPRITDCQGNFLPVEQCENIVVVSHSVGARESVSHIKYAKARLIEAGLSLDTVKSYMSKMLRFNIASPLTEDLESDSSPFVLFLTPEDFGSQRPRNFFERIIANPKHLVDRSVTKITFCAGKNEKVMVVMGPKLVTNGEVVGDVLVSNRNCHALKNHVDAIVDEKKNPELYRILNAYRGFLDKSISSEEFTKNLADIFNDSVRYPAERKAAAEDIERLMEVWHDYVLREEEVIRRAPFAARFSKKGAQQQDTCSRRQVNISDQVNPEYLRAVTQQTSSEMDNNTKKTKGASR